MTSTPVSAALIFAVCAAILTAIPVIGYISERCKWNKGVSKKLGTRWVLASKDSQGGRLYVAERYGATDWAWISFPVDGQWRDTCDFYYIMVIAALIAGIVACLTMSSCTTRVLPDAEPGEVSRPIIESRF
jgi:hypothetical protein